MKKILIHGEYMCILNLIALPFLVMFYNQGNMVFWILLLFLDIAEIMLLIDEKKFLSYVLSKEHHHETQRIKLYLLAMVLIYIYIAFAQSFILVLILLINDGLSSALTAVIHKHVIKDVESGE